MQCLHCQYENLPDAMYCEDCGTKLKHLCPQCQSDNQVPSKFCRKCGTRLTCQSSTPLASLIQTSQDDHASQATQLALPSAQGISEGERRQSKETTFPRCCGIRVLRRKVVACLALYQADGLVHKEIQRYGTQTWELLVLSNWLVAQGVTQVAIASRGMYWPRVYRVLEHALTVRLSPEIKDVEVMVDLLAHGLLQSSSTPPQPLRALLHQQRLRLVASVTVLVAAFLTTYWLGGHPGYMNAEPSFVESPRMVRWQFPQVFYQQPAGTPFTLPLPSLERTPDSLPVEVTLNSSGDQPSWLQFDQDTLRISGTAPITREASTYHLIVDATTDDAGTGQLSLYLTIPGQAQPLLLPSPDSSQPTTSNRPSESNCLLKILKGEPC
jgi:hypothetical protein